MNATNPVHRFSNMPTTPTGKWAAIAGLPAAVLAVVLLVTAAGADNAGLAFLTFLAMVGTVAGGILGGFAMWRRGERSPLVIALVVLAALVLIFMLAEAIFPHA